MFKKILMAGGLAAMLAAPAMAADADNCAAMLKKADAMAQTAKLDDAAKKALADMKAKAEEQAKSGDEDACKVTAGEILKALGG